MTRRELRARLGRLQLPASAPGARRNIELALRAVAGTTPLRSAALRLGYAIEWLPAEGHDVPAALRELLVEVERVLEDDDGPA